MKVRIYRALPATTTTIRNRDFVTRSLRFAGEHAVTSAIYNGEPFFVVRAQVERKALKEDLNPGEFRYYGPDIEGQPYQIADEDTGDLTSALHIKKPLSVRPQENPTDLDWIEDLADEGYGTLEDYYPETAAGELEPSDPYYGRNVIWDGYDGRMIRVKPEYMVAMPENIFDPDKLAAIVSGIREADDRLVFTAPYGLVGVIDLATVKESIEAAEHGDVALDRPLTTGDDELDEYLVDPEQWLEDNYFNDDEVDEIREEMEEALADAVRTRQGDLGELTFQIRDGNHRAFGAILAGEPDLWMIIMENQMQAIAEGFYPEVAERLE